MIKIIIMFLFPCFVFLNNSSSNKTVSQILDKLLMKGHYDLRLRPNYDGKLLIEVTAFFPMFEHIEIMMSRS